MTFKYATSWDLNCQDVSLDFSDTQSRFTALIVRAGLRMSITGETGFKFLVKISQTLSHLRVKSRSVGRITSTSTDISYSGDHWSAKEIISGQVVGEDHSGIVLLNSSVVEILVCVSFLSFYSNSQGQQHAFHYIWREWTNGKRPVNLFSATIYSSLRGSLELWYLHEEVTDF